MGKFDEDSKVAGFLAQTTLFQLCGFFFAFFGWCLCIPAMTIIQWRKWHVEDTTKFDGGVIWIGIWEVCFESDGVPDCQEIICRLYEEKSTYPPKEICIARDLMPLCAVVQTLALGFFFLAYWNIIKNEGKGRITSTFFTIGGFLTLTGGVVLVISPAWNMHAVLNNENITFPITFGMPSHAKYQHVGVAIHLGFVSATLQIASGLIFLCHKCFIDKKTYPSESDMSSCSPSLAASGPYNRSHRKAKSEVTFHIPMGPIPDQRVAPTDSRTRRIVAETAYF